MNCHWLVRASLIGAAFAVCSFTSAQEVSKAEARDMRLVGYSDLQARTAYQPVIQRQGNRWIAYVGHHGDNKLNPLNGRMENNGTSVIDVTDVKNPKYLAHIPGEEGKAEAGGAQMVRVCSGAELPRADKSKFYMLRVFGNQAHEIWNVTDPAKPSLLTTIVKGLKGTHKNFWECDTGIVDARMTWTVAISVIVIGHVVAVWLAHRVALREYGTRRTAAIASIPLTLLMLVCTAISLSVIAEPMVSFEPPTHVATFPYQETFA